MPHVLIHKRFINLSLFFFERKRKKMSDIDILRSGSKNWNKHKLESNHRISIRDFDFSCLHKEDTGDYDAPNLNGFDFSNIDMNMVTMRNGMYEDCDFSGSSLPFSDLCYGYFNNCDFTGAKIAVTKVGSAVFRNCCFDKANMNYISAENTEFIDCSFIGTTFRNAKFVGTDFSGSKLYNCDIYGVSTWDLILENTSMRELSIAKEDQDSLIVDDIEIAQFLYLLVTNEKLRKTIDIITSKVILILGRFTDERKSVLDRIKVVLREHGFVPVLFDFDGPKSRNLSETILTIGSLSKFVIADITEPRSIPQELQILLPNLVSLKVQPIIKIGERPFGMFQDHCQRPALQQLIEYEEKSIDDVVKRIIKELS